MLAEETTHIKAVIEIGGWRQDAKDGDHPGFRRFDGLFRFGIGQDNAKRTARDKKHSGKFDKDGKSARKTGKNGPTPGLSKIRRFSTPVLGCPPENDDEQYHQWVRLESPAGDDGVREKKKKGERK